MTENTNELPQRTGDNRNKPSGLLKKLGITAACVAPIAIFSSLKGYFDGQGTPMIESHGINNALYVATGIPAVGCIGQIIPFRFDNFDPGCLTTILAIPLTVGLSKLSYAIGYSFGSMNK
jgi:hypothetical protein